MELKGGNKLLVSVIALIGIFTLGSGAILASDGPSKKQVSVTLNAGETYVIKNLGAGSTPAVHVVNNPNALIVHSEAPGQLILLGTSAGQWSIDVDTAEGEKVTYKVNVKSIASPFSNPLAPGKTPPPIGSPKFSGNSDKAATVSALDPGSGPVASAIAPKDKAAPTTPVAAADFTAAAGSEASAAVSTPTAAKSGASASLMGEPSSAPVAVATVIGANAPSSSSIGGSANLAGATPPVLAAASSSPPKAFSIPAGVSSPTLPDSRALAANTTPSAVTPASLARTSPSQTASATQQLPPEKFNANPPAPPEAPMEARPSGTHFLPDDVVLMMPGSSRIVDFERRIRRVSIADTEVADLQVVNPYQINLVGHKAGFTTLAVWDKQGRYEERQIRVDANGKQQVMLNVVVAELNRSRLEQQGINWSATFANYPVSLVSLVPGAATPYTPTTSLTTQTVLGAGTPSQTIVSNGVNGTLPISGLIPLLLSSNMTYGLTSNNNTLPFQTFFQFLENHNLAKILAQPHLLANSGEKAEFLSGGEIPIVIAQALNTSIVFKQFGTSVIFVPTVVGKDDVELEVKPEVSQPDFAHGVSLFGFTVPAFVTRRAQTFVRLKSNQTFIIAGLILHTKTSEVDKTPYIGDVPYLGNLFKHTSYNDQESDLVMSVTPQIVQPLPSNGEVALPIDRGPITAGEISTHRLQRTDVSRPRL